MNINPLILIGTSLLLAVIPLAVGVASSYLKISIVLNILKNALGLQQSPGVLAETFLALALSLMVMGPVLDEIGSKASPLLADQKAMQLNKASIEQAGTVLAPWREFLDTHTGEREREFVLRMRQGAKTQQDTSKPTPPQNDVPPQADTLTWYELLPAFLLTELREAFLMGVALLTPFLVIDLIVAQLLTGLGMMMVSPTLVSLPLKLLLFVATNGWVLLSEALLLSYR